MENNYKNYDETLLKEYLKRFRLDGKKKYKKLSKGEKLKFAFAFALAASSETVAAR